MQILYRALRPPIHPIPIRPWSLDAGFGGSGRRREADKRIALSRRNDIFDQHFHITPGRGASRITRQAELSSYLLSPILLFLLASLISSFASRLQLIPTLPDSFSALLYPGNIIAFGARVLIDSSILLKENKLKSR